MIKITDYIHCYENLLDKDLCEAIIENSKNLNFEKAFTLDDENKKNLKNEPRRCYTDWLDKKFNNNIYEAVGKMLKLYSKDHPFFGTGLTTEDTGYQHLIYIGTQQGEYKEHTDHFDFHPRVLSISFLLNDDYEGGNFSFFNKEYILEKKVGSAIVFPSNFCFPHAILPVTQGNRHAVITWIH